jgi:hypothetical protein
LLIAPAISVIEQKISEFTFAAHNVKNVNFAFRLAIEYATWTTYHLTIASAFELVWYFARAWMPLKTFYGGEYAQYQSSRR